MSRINYRDPRKRPSLAKRRMCRCSGSMFKISTICHQHIYESDVVGHYKIISKRTTLPTIPYQRYEIISSAVNCIWETYSKAIEELIAERKEFERNFDKGFFIGHLNELLRNILNYKHKREVAKALFKDSISQYRDPRHSICCALVPLRCLRINNSDIIIGDKTKISGKNIFSIEYAWNIENGDTDITRRIIVPDNYIKKKPTVDIKDVIESIGVRQIETNDQNIQINELTVITKQREDVEQIKFKCLIIFEVK